MKPVASLLYIIWYFWSIQGASCSNRIKDDTRLNHKSQITHFEEPKLVEEIGMIVRCGKRIIGHAWPCAPEAHACKPHRRIYTLHTCKEN